MHSLDAIDLKILELLQKDGRVSHSDLGKAVGLTGSSVHGRIRRLEREGVIRGYTTLLDPEALGQGLVAFVGIRTHGGQDQEQLFERFVVDEPQILECHDVDGEYDYLLKVRTSSPRALRALLASIRSLSGVDRTFTSIALLTVKEIGASAFTPTHDREDL